MEAQGKGLQRGTMFPGELETILVILLAKSVDALCPVLSIYLRLTWRVLN